MEAKMGMLNFNQLKSVRSTSVKFDQTLIDSAHLESNQVLNNLNTTLSGLSNAEAVKRQEQFGPNQVVKEKKQSIFGRILEELKNPLVLLLIGLGVISYLTGDKRATFMILIMVVLGVVLRNVQESRADVAAEKLKAMVSTTASVSREGVRKEISMEEIVPGDIVFLSVGDMVPADLRLILEKDLYINQSTLTGESLPVEKKLVAMPQTANNPIEFSNICFMGSNVVSGSATAVVVNTGKNTYLGSIAHSLVGARVETSFDKGINQFTYLMIGFMAIMVPLVFLINGITKHDWLSAFLFALAVAVGLTPEMLPMIVTVNLSKGALSMAKKKVIVKRLNSIQNFGAMDVLCTDKTGTITQGKVVLEKHLNPRGEESEQVLEYAFVNSYFQTGLKNVMDIAILDHSELEKETILDGKFKKIDEIPFDFERRRMSVVVEDKQNHHFLICKGAVEEVMALCNQVELDGKCLPVLAEHDGHRRERIRLLNEQGFRVIAVAYKEVSGSSDLPTYSVKDETDMVLLGFLAFLDPPKKSTPRALKELNKYHVDVKILTGDNEIVTSSICKSVGLKVERILLGPEIEMMDEDTLTSKIEDFSIFAKLSPVHKERIIHALQKKGHVVGFMGDGINDALALKAADVGISVNSAVDIAKESSDLILLETSLLVLKEGVIEGRRVFGNITKYIRMAASSNFGNMFSVIGASAFLPFVPMLPIQVLTNNLLYDFSQTTIPTDEVDADWLEKPRKWDISGLRRFIIFLGPISSIFDYVTFFMMLYVFNAWNNPALFHTGWFVESNFTQTLIIHVIRTNKIPFIQSRASWPLIATSVAIVGIVAWLTVSPVADALGLVALPPLYWVLLAGILILYIGLTQVVKTWFYKRFGD
jgi:P-type Mg2+ transporter